MNDLPITVTQKIGDIDFDLEGFKEELTNSVAIYKDMVITEDDIAPAKKDLAQLRKVRTAIDDKRKEVKTAFLEPYERFNSQIKEALAIIDEPINDISAKLTDFEIERKAKRKEAVVKIYKANIGDYEEYLPFQGVFSERWLNATSKDKDVVDDIQTAIIKVKAELEVIKCLDSEIEDELLDWYKKGMAVSEVVKKNMDYLHAKAIAESKLRKVEEPEDVEEDVEHIGKIAIYLETREDLEKLMEFMDFNEIKYEYYEEE